MGSITTTLDNVRNALMLILGSITLVMLTVGGVRYVAAGGDSQAIKAAKETIKHALLGFAVAILAPVLITVVKSIIS